MPSRRDLSELEKQQVIERHGRACFITGHPLEETEALEFDHILPVDSGGPTELENLAPVCRLHNRQKGTLSLGEYRDKLRLDTLFDDSQPKYLDDIIRAKGKVVGRGISYQVMDGDDTVNVYFENSGNTFPLYRCPKLMPTWNPHERRIRRYGCVVIRGRGVTHAGICDAFVMLGAG